MKGDKALAIGALGVALLAYVPLGLSNARASSATFDEVIHLPPGYMNLRFADHRLNPDHPPLLRMVVAAPLLVMPIRVELDDLAWRTGRPWEFGKRFLFRWNDADRLLWAGRVVSIGIGAALVATVWAWSWRLFGPAAATLSALLCALEPNLVAHGSLIGNDLPITLLTLLAVMALERLAERITPARAVSLGLVLGAAVATKFSAVGLLPIVAMLALAMSWRYRTPPRPLLGALILAGVVALVVVWAAYGFVSPLARDPDLEAKLRRDFLEGHGLTHSVLLWTSRAHLLPEAWVYGFLHFVEHSESRPAFLLGQRSETGWWYYFPVTLALKTPIPLIALAVAGIVLALRRPRGRTEWLLWLPAAFYLAVTVTRHINIGHRHVLPLYPFLIVAAGRVAAAAWEARRTGALAAIATLVVWQAVSVLRVHPHELAYFNELAGGPANGWRIAVDSSLDWGQDLITLREYMRRAGIPRVKLAYFGTADPEYYQVACDRLPGYQPPPPSALAHDVKPGDVVAVSATLLQGVYAPPELLPLVERLRAQAPLANVGGSILVYRSAVAWSAP